jgi:hypothetical protein
MSTYASLAYCDDYFSRRLWTSAWDLANTEDRQKALYHAEEIIDGLNFVGDKADEEQEHQFPRGDDTEIPTPIKRATCLLALALLDGAEPNKDFENLFKNSVSFGGVRTTYESTPVAGHLASGVPSYEAWRLLFPFLRDPAAINLRRVN